MRLSPNSIDAKISPEKKGVAVFTYDDLNDPEIATAVTRALIKLIPGPIGKTPEERAVGWKTSWNSSLGAGSVERYLEDMPFLYKE